MKFFWKILIGTGVISCILAVLFILASVYVASFSDITSNEDASEVRSAVIVLGAKVYDDGTLSAMLEDRVKVALELYENGKAEKILLSGDHGQTSYDEVNSMKNYLLDRGVSPEDIFLDHAGFDTYDSIYRAKEIFGVNSTYIVTQNFHLPRAIYIAKTVGIEAEGVSADLQVYRETPRLEQREILARIKAFIDVVLKSKPKYLGEQIPITGDGRASWD